jgi:hypothetical protein
MELPYEPLAKFPKAVLALVSLLFSFVLEAMRSLFQQLVAAASPWSAVFDHAATIPSEFTQVFSFPRAMLPT